MKKVLAVFIYYLLFLTTTSISFCETHPRVKYPAIKKGSTALRMIGNQLPRIARKYRIKSGNLRTLLRKDSSLAIDRTGALFFEEQNHDGIDYVSVNATDNGFNHPGSTIPLDETFTLHSRPGSQKLIYLDFDGHQVTGTAWNANYTQGASFAAPAWSLDGDTSTYNDEERAVIQDIWRRVSEDFAPFDVDVTTEYPGEARLTRISNADVTYGVRVVISPISKKFKGPMDGIAYVGIFNLTTSYYQPAFAFSDSLRNSTKAIGESVSHQVGHTLGLYHDGTSTTGMYAGHGSGDTSWAPIMGNGLNRSVTQFNRGEYTGTNNAQNDIAIISKFYIPLASDDYGDTIESAQSIPTAPRFEAKGIIGQDADIDVFSFETTGGPITLAISPSNVGPNLDIVAELKDSSGNTIVSSNPPNQLSTTIEQTVAGGRYYLAISNTGNATPTTGYSSYGSLGQYTIVGTVPVSNPPSRPVVVMEYTPLTYGAPVVVGLSGSQSYDGDGWISSCQWNFGDGETSSQCDTSHTYSNSGSFNIALTVYDNDEQSSSSVITLIVSESTPTPTPAPAPNQKFTILVKQRNGKAVSKSFIKANRLAVQLESLDTKAITVFPLKSNSAVSGRMKAGTYMVTVVGSSSIAEKFKFGKGKKLTLNKSSKIEITIPLTKQKA